MPHSLDDWLEISSPKINGEFDRCQVFDIDFDNVFERPPEETGTIECKSWEYDAIYFDVSITT